MAIDLIPSPFWKFPTLGVPSVFSDDEDSWAQIGSTGISVSEDDKHVFVSANIPGVDEKNIDMTFDKGYLWIKGEQAETEEDKKRKFYRRATSSFSYRVAVPGDIDLGVDPEASYKNGVMTVRFTKSPASQPKKISVKSAK